MRGFLGFKLTLIYIFLSSACVAERGKYINERSPLIDETGGSGSIPEPSDAVDFIQQPQLDMNFGALDEKLYNDSFHPKNCIDYRPWRRNVVGALTVYGSTPNGGDKLWAETIANRKTYAQRDPRMHPELTKIITMNPSELEKYESTGAILAINVADLMPQVWYDLFAICGHITKKTGLKGSALSEKLKKVFRLDFSYGEAFDVALIKAKLERIRFLLSKPVGHFAYIQFAEFREGVEKISSGNNKYYLSANALEKISGPIFKILIMDVYTLYDMANSLGIFNANPQNAATTFSTFVSDLNTNWLLRNIGVAYSSEKKFYDRTNQSVINPWRLSNDNEFYAFSHWSWDKDQQRFFSAEKNKGVLPPAVLRVDLMASSLEQLEKLALGN